MYKKIIIRKFSATEPVTRMKCRVLITAEKSPPPPPPSIRSSPATSPIPDYTQAEKSSNYTLRKASFAPFTIMAAGAQPCQTNVLAQGVEQPGLERATLLQHHGRPPRQT